MKRFLLATDFSKASENAFKYVKAMVNGKDIKVDIINVYELPLAYSTQTPLRAVQGYLHELHQAASRRLNDLLQQLDESNQGDTYPVHGVYPSSEIEDTADDIDADLIIMSLRQDYGIMRRLIGNTTSRTIHKSSIPVMAIPANARYKKIDQILFPTALTKNQNLTNKELKAIKWLSSLSGFLDIPHIELLHIVDDGDTQSVDVTTISSHLDHLKLTHRHSISVEDGIYEYMGNKQPDLLAFYKPHRTFWERLYRPAKTRHLLYDSSVPLIIF